MAIKLKNIERKAAGQAPAGSAQAALENQTTVAAEARGVLRQVEEHIGGHRWREAAELLQSQGFQKSVAEQFVDSYKRLATRQGIKEASADWAAHAGTVLTQLTEKIAAARGVSLGEAKTDFIAPIEVQLENANRKSAELADEVRGLRARLESTQAERDRFKNLHEQQADTIRSTPVLAPALSPARFKTRPMPEPLKERFVAARAAVTEQQLEVEKARGKLEAAQDFAKEISERLVLSERALQELKDATAGLSREKAEEFERERKKLDANIQRLTQARDAALTRVTQLESAAKNQIAQFEATLATQRAAGESLAGRLSAAETTLRGREKEMSAAERAHLRTGQALEAAEAKIVAQMDEIRAQSRLVEKARLDLDLMRKLSGDADVLRTELLESRQTSQKLQIDLRDASRQLTLARNDLSDKATRLEELQTDLRIERERLSAIRSHLEHFLVIMTKATVDYSASESSRDGAMASKRALRALIDDLQAGGPNFPHIKDLLDELDRLFNGEPAASSKPAPVTQTPRSEPTADPVQSQPTPIPAPTPPSRSETGASDTPTSARIVEEAVVAPAIGSAATNPKSWLGRMLSRGTSAPIPGATPAPTETPQEQDRRTFGEFWNDVITPLEGSVLATEEAYAAYRTWTEQRGSTPVPFEMFDRFVIQSNLARKAPIGNKMRYLGVALKYSGPTESDT